MPNDDHHSHDFESNKDNTWDGSERDIPKEGSQRGIVLRYYKNCYPLWLAPGRLVNIGTAFGNIGSSGPRRARELHEQEFLESRRVGKIAEYRFLGPGRRCPCPSHAPWGSRGENDA